MGRSLPCPILEPLQTRVIQEEDLGAAQLLPHTQTMLGTPHVSRRKSLVTHRLQGNPPPSCLLQQEMELKAAQAEVSLTFSTHSSPALGTIPPPVTVLSSYTQFWHLLMIFNNNLTLSPCISPRHLRQPGNVLSHWWRSRGRCRGHEESSLALSLSKEPLQFQLPLNLLSGG